MINLHWHTQALSIWFQFKSLKTTNNLPSDSTALTQSNPTSFVQMWCYLPSKHCALNTQETKDFRLANSTCQASNGPTNLIWSSVPRLTPSHPLDSPHSNNCPPLSRKTLVPLENSITRLHKRFKIMVLSLCGERECTWPRLEQEDALRHSGISGRYYISAYWSSC